MQKSILSHFVALRKTFINENNSHKAKESTEKHDLTPGGKGRWRPTPGAKTKSLIQMICKAKVMRADIQSVFAQTVHEGRSRKVLHIRHVPGYLMNSSEFCHYFGVQTSKKKILFVGEDKPII